MNPLLAIVSSTDFDAIAIAVILFAVAFTPLLIKRLRLNLRRVESKLDAILQHHGIASPSKLSPEVQRLASDPNQKIAAIKLHRQQTGVSLAEAKAEVEEFSN